MQDMAIEWLEQVLSFLPLPDVYKCKSVCKEWQAAANDVIRNWKTLVLVVRDSKTLPVRTHNNQIFMDRAAISPKSRSRFLHWRMRNEQANRSHAQSWIKRLKQLVRLKEIRFDIMKPLCGESLVPVVDDIVLRNASTLTRLHIGSQKLPFDPKRPVVFHKLRDLECSQMDYDQAAACPRLVKLRAGTSSVKGLQKIPAETLTSLHIVHVRLENELPKEIGQLFAAFSRFTRLKCLILVGGFRYFPAGHDRAFNRLFANMKELEEVAIRFQWLMDNVVW